MNKIRRHVRAPYLRKESVILKFLCIFDIDNLLCNKRFTTNRVERERPLKSLYHEYLSTALINSCLIIAELSNKTLNEPEVIQKVIQSCLWFWATSRTQLYRISIVWVASNDGQDSSTGNPLCWNISLQFYQLFKIKSLKVKFVNNN